MKSRINANSNSMSSSEVKRARSLSPECLSSSAHNTRAAKSRNEDNLSNHKAAKGKNCLSDDADAAEMEVALPKRSSTSSSKKSLKAEGDDLKDSNRTENEKAEKVTDKLSFGDASSSNSSGNSFYSSRAVRLRRTCHKATIHIPFQSQPKKESARGRSSSKQTPSPQESSSNNKSCNSASPRAAVDEVRESTAEMQRRSSSGKGIRTSTCDSVSNEKANSNADKFNSSSSGGNGSSSSNFSRSKRMLGSASKSERIKQRRDASEKTDASSASSPKANSSLASADVAAAASTFRSRQEPREGAEKAATNEIEIEHLSKLLQQTGRYSRPRYRFSIHVLRGAEMVTGVSVDVPIEEQCPLAPLEPGSSVRP